jgi:hypothetical protein
MKIPVALATAVLSATIGSGTALAFSCPTLVKAANEAIAAAEPRAAAVSGDRDKARAAGMVEEAKALSKGAEADHGAGQHGRSEAKAKAAKWLADQVK